MERSLFLLIGILLLVVTELIKAEVLTDGIDVKCDGHGMTARFEDSYVKSMTKYEPQVLKLLNNPQINSTVECSTTKSSEGYWEVSSGLESDCVYEQKEEDGNTIYEFRAVLKLKLPENQTVSHEHPKAAVFSCVYSKIVKIQSFKIDAYAREVNLQVLSKGKYDVEMKIYKDSNYEEEFATQDGQAVFLSNDRVYVQLSTNLEGNVLKIDKCMISSQPSFNDNIITLIDGGCSMQTNSISLPILKQQGQISRFNFDASQLIGDGDSVVTNSYLRCHVTLCNSKRQQGCFDAPLCGANAQVKRQAIYPQSCKEMNCEGLCGTRRGHPFCICPPNKILNSDGRSCDILQRNPNHKTKDDYEKFYVIMLFCAIFVAAFIASCSASFCCMCDKKKINSSEFEPIIEMEANQARDDKFNDDETFKFA